MDMLYSIGGSVSLLYRNLLRGALLTDIIVPLDIAYIKDIEEMGDETDEFKDLVLPRDQEKYYKEVIKVLVKTHARGPRAAINANTPRLEPISRDIDLVKGKGKDLFILLHGVPGVGKTSTAECVAANTIVSSSRSPAAIWRERTQLRLRKS